MPWKETCRMDEKLVFVADCLRGELPMAALCGDYGISRKTGYNGSVAIASRARRAWWSALVRRTVTVGRWRRSWPRRLSLCAGSVPIGVRASCAQC